MTATTTAVDEIAGIGNIMTVFVGYCTRVPDNRPVLDDIDFVVEPKNAVFVYGTLGWMAPEIYLMTLRKAELTFLIWRQLV